MGGRARWAGGALVLAAALLAVRPASAQIDIHCVPHMAVHIGCQDSHATIQSALDHAKLEAGGGIVLIGAGTYAERVGADVDGSTIMSPAGPTSFEAAGPGVTVVDAVGPTGDGAAVRICGSDNRIEGLTVRAGPGSDAYGILLCGGGNSFVRNNYIVAAGVGIGVSGASNSIIERNRVTGAVGFGIVECCGAGANTFEANVVERNGAGLLISSAESRVAYNVIEGNRGTGIVSGAPPSDLVDARYNWWGAATGPGTLGADAAGAGVNFFLWCVLPDCSDMRLLVGRGILPP